MWFAFLSSSFCVFNELLLLLLRYLTSMVNSYDHVGTVSS